MALTYDNQQRKPQLATDFTEEHEKNYFFKAFIFPCSSVDSAAIKPVLSG